MAEALADSCQRTHYERQETFLPLGLINTLNQVRRTFDRNDIRSLAENICKWGLIDPITAVSFNRDLCQEYINLTNKYHRSNHQLQDLIPTADGRFIIMLSGERRLRAHRLIWAEGCAVCRERYGQEPPGTCFTRHFGPFGLVENEAGAGGFIRAHLYRGIPAIDAIDIQLSGNSYIPPPDAEIMEICSLQFRVKREKNPRLTIADFARSIGKSPSTISDYLKIFELPAEVLEFLQVGLISSGVAREIAFLQDNGEKDLMWWTRRAAFGRLKTKDLHKKIREHLASRQQTMLEIFDATAEQEAKKAFVKKQLDEVVLNNAYQCTAYFSKCLQALKEGKIGKEDSLFSSYGPTNLYRKQVEVMRDKVFSYISEQLPKKSLDEVREVLASIDVVLAKQEELVKQEEIAK